jgi:hypothetical protein
MSPPAWERYVASIGVDGWGLDPSSLVRLMGDIEVLIASGDVTNGSIATVLRMAGVPRREAELLAPSIRAAVDEARISPPTSP